MKRHTVVFTGGLCNQMFQYAYGRALQERGAEVTFNTSLGNTRPREDADLRPQPNLTQDAAMRYVCAYGLDLYNTKITFSEPVGDIVDGGMVFNPLFLNPPSPTTLKGVWFSEKYFDNIHEQLRSELTLLEVPSEIYAMGQALLSEPGSVSVHVRRGDYALPIVQEHQHYLGQEWFKQAQKVMSLKSLEFFVFSDDVEWCRDKIPGTVVSTGNRYHDLYLMSCCHNAIISASTYSWWGAWLGPEARNGTVVGPERMLAKGYIEDYVNCLPERWIRL
jgi:hypothetical protein